MANEADSERVIELPEDLAETFNRLQMLAVPLAVIIREFYHELGKHGGLMPLEVRDQITMMYAERLIMGETDA